MHTLLQPASNQEDEWRCESCHGAIHPSGALIEESYGFEGEAWGTFFPAEVFTHAISPCCRSFIIDDYGNYLQPDSVNDYW